MQIQNVVASVDLKTRLPLERLLEELELSEYQPDTFPGLVFRFHDPSATFLIFQTGKIICVGAGTMKIAKESLEKLIKRFDSMKLKMPKTYSVKIENIVATDNIGKKLNVDELVFSLHESEYTPDTFPGVVYRISDPKASFLLFSSGRIVCAGTRSIADAQRAIDTLVKTLKHIKAI